MRVKITRKQIIVMISLAVVVTASFAFYAVTYGNGLPVSGKGFGG